MNPALRSSAAHVFVPSLHDPQPSPDDAHHLFRVLRLRDGESVTVSDGAGSWLEAHVAGQVLQVSGEVHHEPPPPALTIASAIPKGDRAEWMVQKLTEIGVAEVVFLHCARSVVRWEGERGERQQARLRRVAREAAMQSRRVWLPIVGDSEAFLDAVRRPGAVVADPTGQVSRCVSDWPLTVLIGPEGGFTPDELAAAPALVGLSDQVLRVETAALVAAARFLT